MLKTPETVTESAGKSYFVAILESETFYQCISMWNKDVSVIAAFSQSSAGLKVVVFCKVAVVYWQGSIDVSIRAALHSAAAW